MSNDANAKDGFYFHKCQHAISNENKRTFSISLDQYETPEHNLSIPYKPQITPFTNWSVLHGIHIETQETIKIEFRFKVANKLNLK